MRSFGFSKGILFFKLNLSLKAKLLYNELFFFLLKCGHWFINLGDLEPPSYLTLNFKQILFNQQKKTPKKTKKQKTKKKISHKI
jgi:hypothetical protein